MAALNSSGAPVIIVTGSVLASPETLAEMLRISVEHVHRSLAEPGCLNHGVYQSAEDPHRLFFYEQWADRAAIEANFHVREGIGFAAALGKMSAERPSIEILTVADEPS